MSVVLYLIGLVVAVAGLGAIGVGIPYNEFGIGGTLIMSGTAALMGGLIMIGLGAAVGQLRKIEDALAGAPAPRATRPAETFEPKTPAPGPRPAAPARAGKRARDLPPAPPPPWPLHEQAEERLPSAPSIDVAQDQPDQQPMSFPPNAPRQPMTRADEFDDDLPPLGAPQGRQATPAPQQAKNEDFGDHGRAAPPPKSSVNGSGARREPAIDETWTTKQNVAPQSGVFDAMWPTPESSQKTPAQRPAQPAAARPEPSRGEQVKLRPSQQEPRVVAILKSGVVDGMAYTLYVDGSIEAELPQGTLRFASINELRAHLEKNS